MGRPAKGARAPWIVTALSLVASAALVVAALIVDGAASPAAAGGGTPRAAAAQTATEPEETGPAADTAAYDVSSLPLIDIWTVDPALPLDDDPFQPTTGDLATPRGDAPLFAAPGEEPLGRLAAIHRYGGTTVPVVERTTHWVKVLLAGRQGLPPDGDAGQAVGWLRAADVELTRSEQYVEVHLEARTLDIVTAAGVERVVDDFAWGKPSTPTPTGRTFIMLTEVVPSFEYTEGHPIVYLAVQSPTLAGFDGGDVAVTSFHYYKTRSGPNSFGCIYLDAASITRLAQLPAGTPVIIYE